MPARPADRFAGGLVVAELIDPETGAVKRMEPDATGELVFTTLKRRACPLIRLRSHDTVRVFTDPCEPSSGCPMRSSVSARPAA